VRPRVVLWEEGGNQKFGFYTPDYKPRKAAHYLHNLTTILADKGTLRKPGKLGYSIPKQPATVHDMLLQNSNGMFQLWSCSVRIGHHRFDSTQAPVGMAETPFASGRDTLETGQAFADRPSHQISQRLVIGATMNRA
jgi:hypothetical protein